MNFDDYVRQGFAFMEKKEYEQALKSYKEAQKLKDSPDIQEVIRAVEGIAYAQTQISQSLADEAGHRAAIMGINVEDIDEVITEYTETLKRNPNDASVKDNLAFAYYIRGLIFASKMEHKKAIDAYSYAIKYMPDYPHAFFKRGQEYSEIGDYDKAIADIEELIRLNPNYENAHELLERIKAEKAKR